MPAPHKATATGAQSARVLPVTLRPRHLVMAACGLALAYAAFLQSFDMTLGARNPALAERIHPLPQTEVRTWMLAAMLDPKKAADPAIADAARKALRSDPYDAQPLRALAYQRDAIGRTGEAERLARLSVEVTRRDELTQLLLTRIEARAGRERQALQHLSTAISTTDRGREAIYDIMTPLLANAALRQELAALATQRNMWMQELLLHALRKGGDNARFVAEVLLLAPSAQRNGLSQTMVSELISALAEAGEADLTRRVLVLQFPGEGGLLRDPSISSSTAREALGWLGWTPVETGATGAQLGATAQGGWGALAYAAPGKSGVAVLRRVLMLPPGAYRLTDRRSQLSGDRNGRFDWSVQCFISGSWVGRALLRGGPAGQTFTVGPDCPMQRLELQAFTSSSGEGVEATIDQLTIRR